MNYRAIEESNIIQLAHQTFHRGSWHKFTIINGRRRQSAGQNCIGTDYYLREALFSRDLIVDIAVVYC